MKHSRGIAIALTLSVLGVLFYARTDRSIFDPRSGSNPQRGLARTGVSSLAELTNFWQKQRCENIFSEKNLLGALNDPAPWWPVCSPAIAHYFSLQSPSSTETEIAQLVSKTLQGWDLCRVGAPQQMRNSSTYVAPSRAQRKVELLSPEEQLQTQLKVDQLKKRAESLCCSNADPHLCQKMFESTRVEWCNPEADPSKPDACVGTPNAFETTTWYTPGRLVLSPVKTSTGMGLSDNPKSLLHELGHACSAVRQTTKRLFQSFGCKINDGDRRMYQALFTRFGASDETWQCVQELAAGAEYTRFSPYESCSKGCPLSYLEEAFADFFAVQALSPEELVQSVPDFCRSYRDNNHALRADEFRCFLRSPAVKDKFAKSLQCSL